MLVIKLVQTTNQITCLFYSNMFLILILTTMLYVIMISQQVHGKVITVNNNGTISSLCCRDGICVCNSLYMALTFTNNNTVINITSPAVSLNNIVLIGFDNGVAKNLNNITITSNGDATVMCHNTGTVFCAMCSNVIVKAITWDQCGDINYPNTSGITFLKASNVSIINCIFQNFVPCVAVEVSYSTGDINVT